MFFRFSNSGGIFSNCCGGCSCSVSATSSVTSLLSAFSSSSSISPSSSSPSSRSSLEAMSSQDGSSVIMPFDGITSGTTSAAFIGLSSEGISSSVSLLSHL
ncbi:hypothetical protein NP493_486g01019 [Ridgeia piscesae]|uniref:Uncharacterized protein n=1 Tax=Ridgeia piscesae TaxID=27915 RepID=A0AAD9NQY9_RIDPI|nr:hypothetical protein NP493_486g01019 [Ridgeia piscesae]